MKKYLALFFLGFGQVMMAQINPIGFRMTVKGGVEIITEGQSYKTSDRIDSVLVISTKDTNSINLMDLNIKYLELMSPPEGNWTDGSMVYRERAYDAGSNAMGRQFQNLTVIDLPLNVSAEPVTENPSGQSLFKKPQFEDVIIFHGDLNPELEAYFRRLLDNHIEKHKGIAEEDDDWDAIGDLLALEDTVENEGLVYPGLVDKLVFYKYEEERLSTITGYYFDMTALERDSLQYDERGNLTYFHRETVGYGGERLYFTYNDKNQLIEYKSDYYDFHSDSYDPCPSCKVLTEYEHFFFTYDVNGYLTSKDNKTNEYTPHHFFKVFPHKK